MTKANGGIFGERPGVHRDIGNIWESRSNGRCLFAMPSNSRFDEIVRKITS